MTGTVKDRRAMIRRMNPRLDPLTYVFCSGGEAHPGALATFAEDEGVSQILTLDAALETHRDTTLSMMRIVLEVHSALEGVGLTAAVAGALADAGIACNMVAAFHHDHVFVPSFDAPRAMAILRALQSAA